MAEGGTYTRCPYCDRWVDTTASDVVYAVKQSDGTGAFFHSCCPPER